ncbi:olfactory receptor 11A1-like [Spea bombifrons]|uniref:olfactory receptor 11A1-like n=1 Tax=Spea bombifrons TaxID=233779 RepID=UPI00234B5B83|nr:olfactory receptor 11A1-like [Spea bombifrons]
MFAVNETTPLMLIYDDSEPSSSTPFYEAMNPKVTPNDIQNSVKEDNGNRKYRVHEMVYMICNNAKTMSNYNKTIVTEFIIIGFKNLHQVRTLLFIFLLLTYIAIFIGNFFIVTLVPFFTHLHTPMYFFLGNLSLSDILITTNLIPNMLHIIWTEEGSMPITDCIVQFYIFGSLTATECLLLTVMSYDRYLAICSPLRYSSIMTIPHCRYLIVFSWLLGFTPTLPVAICLSKLLFCNLNSIDHFFCDLAPFLELACSDITLVKFVSFILSFLVTVFPFFIILTSYAFIIYTIVRMQSEKGRQKAFSTCSSHLTVVFMYYGTLFILYGVPSQKHSLEINKLLSLLYTIVTPLLNPVIYSLKNKDFAEAAEKMFKKTFKK